MKLLLLLACFTFGLGIVRARSLSPRIADPNHLSGQPTPAPPLRPRADAKPKVDPKQLQEGMLSALSTAPATLKLKSILDWLVSHVAEPAVFNQHLTELQQTFTEWTKSVENENTNDGAEHTDLQRKYSEDLLKRIDELRALTDKAWKKALEAAGFKLAPGTTRTYELNGVLYQIHFAGGAVDIGYAPTEYEKATSAPVVPLDISGLLRQQKVTDPPRTQIGVVPRLTANPATARIRTVKGVVTVLYDKDKKEPEFKDNDETTPIDWKTVEREVLPAPSAGLLTGNPLPAERVKALEQIAAKP